MDKGEIAFAMVMLAIIATVGFFLVKYPPDLPSQRAAPVQVEKPQTKTRCDFTGVFASQIIAEEAANGYRFNGRVSTFICGENGLSFSLEQ